jgi:hypothetical protein
MASWLGLSSFAIALVAVDRFFATLRIEADPSFCELAPGQSEMASDG